VAVFLFIMPIRAMIRTKREMLDYDENHGNIEPDALTEIGATVYTKRTYGKYVGSSKSPTYTTVYEITFLTEDGGTAAYEVARELYDRLAEGTAGRLVTQSGEFFDFGDGESI
ncbi:MAG: DUF2500 family protein, partial [Clostridia bacterium]|nr:DUF2500 family protein [Clostridia bacterium]